MRLAAIGFQEIAADIAAMGTHARSAAREALRAVGQGIRRDLKAAAARAAPVGHMTAALKAVKKRGRLGKEALRSVARHARPTKPWGRSAWTVHVPRNLLKVYVSTRGANVLMEHGGTVRVDERLKRFLHVVGVHLRRDAYSVRPRPVFGPVYQARKEAMYQDFRREFFRRLGAKISRWSMA
jgi:hypothetical protein